MRTCIAVALLLVPGLAVAQTARPAVTPADYGKFESPGPAQLSPDGRWLAYVVNRVDEANTLRIRDLSSDRERTVPYGSALAFTADSRWVAYAIGVSVEERERLEREKKPVRNGLGLVNLATGDSVAFPAIASFAFSPDARFIALRGYPAEGVKVEGAELLVRELATGTTSHFGGVTAYAWADRAARLAMTVRSPSDVGNGVHLYDAVAGRLRVLDSSGDVYRGLAWRKNADDLAVLRTVKEDGWADTTHVVLAFQRVAGGSPLSHRLAAAPMEQRIAETFTPRWSDDGSVVFLGLRPRRRAEPKDTSKDEAAAEKLSDVQVWHARDVRIQPQQRVQEEQDLRATLRAAWRPGEPSAVVLGTRLDETVTVLEGARHAIETDASKYTFGRMFGRPARDIDRIDVRTGERRRVLEDVRFGATGSATGRYLTYFRDNHWWVYDVGRDKHVNVTERTGATFENREYDYPVEQLPPLGLAGWSKDDAWLLVYDEFDVWRVAPDGSGGTRLTNGAVDRLVHRVLRLDRDEPGLDLTKPLYLALTGKTSKRSGFARLAPGQPLETLVLEDARVTRLLRADSADVFAFTKERFEDPPAWFAGHSLAEAKRVAGMNPFIGDYAWGRGELIDFVSENGDSLQAALFYPANHDPATTYPMIVYTYEIVSTQLHGFVTPTERSYYNAAAWTAQGYFVLYPDIVYRGRDPGRSAVAAVAPAVNAVVRRGLVDPARIGLVGHSWGGYQATYIPTQTDIFTASVAGAPITNFLSFAGAIHWRPGIPEFDHWETGQARMDVPYWEDLDAYLRNSPAAHIDKLKTPMLMMFGDDDGTVDWHQGIEFYNFARRAGRDDFVLLVYPGEDHGLRKKENQIDYHRRILEWFGHWLKGDKAPGWMRDGVTHLERKRALERGKAGGG